MGDGGVEVGHHPHGQDPVQVLGAPVGLLRRDRFGEELAGARAASDLHALLVEPLEHLREQTGGGLRVAEQGLERVAHRHLTDLRIAHDVRGHLQVGARIEEDVADALIVREHGNPRLVRDLADQPRPTPRNQQVQVPVHLQEMVDGVAIGGGEDLHAVLGQPDVAGGRPQLLAQRTVRVEGLGAPAEDHGIARLHAERGRVHRHVGPRLVDDADHPQRDAHAPHPKAVGAHRRVRDLAHGIGQGGYLPQPVHHVLPLAARQRQTPDHRGGEPLLGAATEGFDSLLQVHGSGLRGIRLLEEHQVVAVYHLVPVRVA